MHSALAYCEHIPGQFTWRFVITGFLSSYASGQLGTAHTLQMGCFEFVPQGVHLRHGRILLDTKLLFQAIIVITSRGLPP